MGSNSPQFQDMWRNLVQQLMCPWYWSDRNFLIIGLKAEKKIPGTMLLALGIQQFEAVILVPGFFVLFVFFLFPTSRLSSFPFLLVSPSPTLVSFLGLSQVFWRTFTVIKVSKKTPFSTYIETTEKSPVFWKAITLANAWTRCYSILFL